MAVSTKLNNNALTSRVNSLIDYNNITFNEKGIAEAYVEDKPVKINDCLLNNSNLNIQEVVNCIKKKGYECEIITNYYGKALRIINFVNDEIDFDVFWINKYYGATYWYDGKMYVTIYYLLDDNDIYAYILEDSIEISLDDVQV